MWSWRPATAATGTATTTRTGGTPASTAEAPASNCLIASENGCRTGRQPVRHPSWLEHGTDPAGATNAYPLMPGASRRTPAACAADEDRLEILDNIADRQAVPSPGLTATNPGRAGTVGRLTVTAPASVLVRRRRSVLDLRISEPRRTGRPLTAAADHSRYRGRHLPHASGALEGCVESLQTQGVSGC
ncbi:polysaccharide lyase beta-sandwich domain-containing protein [Streptomyces sp. NPDC056527]|uniref:polysaccharide lyase beta-sandwich domain-containing protein n=1 Tax=Streptomyces sp. NPDC056527 TaxID=3345853 RepID=UPI0036A0C3FF